MSNPIRITVEAGDVLNFKCDVIALKYAQQLYGVDKAIVSRLQTSSRSISFTLPNIDEHQIIPSNNILGAKYVLIIGVVTLNNFRYKEIREFGYKSLTTLLKELPDIKHFALTLHGVSYGFDETESFEAEIAGLVDALNDISSPNELEHITIVEIRMDRVTRLKNILSRLFPSGLINTRKNGISIEPNKHVSSVLRAVGYASASKPSIFVAMPYCQDMEDVFHYGIQGAVNAVGALCERSDLSPFTGDIMNWIKERIGKSSLVIADLTGANPNVYLEVGYAWGCGKPTILIAQTPEDLKFDLRGYKCLIYKSIKELEHILFKELKALYVTSSTNREEFGS